MSILTEKLGKQFCLVTNAVGSYFMNRKWLDRMKAKASKAYYREPGHYRETPSEYFIRKNELLTTVNNLDDSEIIMEVMDTAPANWSTILTTQSYKDVVEFQAAIRYHEDSLMRLGGTGNLDRADRWKDPSHQTRGSRSVSLICMICIQA